MAMYATPKEAPPTCPPGTHHLQLMTLEEDNLEGSRNPEVWRFNVETRDVLDEEGNPFKLDGIASRNLTPKSKSWAWFEAFGLKLTAGVPVNLEDAVGGEALGVISNKPGSDGTGLFARIDSIIPMPGTVATPTPANDIGSWWAEVRNAGPTVKEATEKAIALYSKEPKDCSVLERAAVLLALTA